MNPPASWTPIYLDQHALLVGMTGSGKSTRMVRELAWRMARLQAMRIPPSIYKMIIVDTKPVSLGQDDNLGHYGWTGGTIYRNWQLIDLAREPNQLLIYRPEPNLIDPTEFGNFFNHLLDFRYRSPDGRLTALPFTVVIDELVDIFADEKVRSRYLEGFSKILVQGRSAKQTLWILTQFPVYIDPAIKRNVSARFCFRLPDENDRKVMAGVLGAKMVSKPIRTQHGFYYQNEMIQSTMEQPVFFDGKEPAGARRRRRAAIS